MNKCFKALFAMVVFPLLILLTGCNSDSGSTEPTVKLESILIVASPITTRGVSELKLAKGNQQPFEATGSYSDGSSEVLTKKVEWHSSDEAIATVTSEGELSGVNAGSTTVTATLDDITSNPVDVTVTDSVITAIQVTPEIVNVAEGQTKQLTVTATYDDNSSNEVTKKVEWHSSDEAIAIVTPEGELSGVNVGPTTVTATLDDITSNEARVTVTDAVITAIQVTPSSVSLPLDLKATTLDATAMYSDGTTSGVTSDVEWSSDNEAIAIVTHEGELSGVSVGPTTVTATLGDITSNDVEVTVTDAVMTEIQVTPSSVTIPKGLLQDLTVTATYSDGTKFDITSYVEWSSGNEAIAIVTPEGELFGVGVGPTTVTATLGGISSNKVEVTITDAVMTAIQVTPAIVNVAEGQTQQLTATATYSDGTTYSVTSDVSWHSNNSLIAIVTPEGELSGVNVGPTTVTATYDDITSNEVKVTVTDAVITGIQVTPSSVTIPKGLPQDLTVTATYSDDTESDVSRFVEWHSDNPDVVTVENITSRLTASRVNMGDALVTATMGDFHDAVVVKVTNAVITGIYLSTQRNSVTKGYTEQLKASGKFSDGMHYDVTDLAEWFSDDISIATVSTEGVLYGVDVGSAIVKATMNNLDVWTNVTVTTPVITDIQITPSSVTLAEGQTQQLTAMATDVNGAESDVTNSADWHSNNPDIATVTSEGVFGVESGSTTVTATYGGSTSHEVDVTVKSISGLFVQADNVGTPLRLVEGDVFEVVAMVIYADGTGANVSDSVTWLTTNDDVADVMPPSEISDIYAISAISAGTATISVTLGGYVSDTSLNVEVCTDDLAGACIDIFDAGDGKLFTSSPSKPYLDSIGEGTETGDGREEVEPEGFFYSFNWYDANELCTTYNEHNLGGRGNWRLATLEELNMELFGTFGNMFTARGWPSSFHYWSVTPGETDGKYYTVYLNNGRFSDTMPTQNHYTYASCVSNNP
ncbi:Ig-like domain-containing protein [uncultured Vibrio sp.]|uniref:Ig-like domain-containing protein n=1 Tax=uncultured Vibrio sp. TaxID=114054 RepID=UPI00260F4256|nr:Ig-like domain-containing protein [uncultured Vibrio sp.]